MDKPILVSCYNGATPLVCICTSLSVSVGLLPGTKEKSSDPTWSSSSTAGVVDVVVIVVVVVVVVVVAVIVVVQPPIPMKGFVSIFG